MSALRPFPFVEAKAGEARARHRRLLTLVRGHWSVLSLWALALVLALAVAACVAAWALVDDRWTETWLPALGAELFGMMLVVIVLDLTLGHIRRRDEVETLEPLRREVAQELEEAIRPLINFAVWTEAAGKRAATPPDVRQFFANWYRCLTEHQLDDALWLWRFGTLVGSLGAQLERFQQFERADLTPATAAAVREARRELGRAATVIAAAATCADDGDPVNAIIVLDICKRLSEMLGPLFDAYEALCGHRITTEAAWAVWRTIHAASGTAR